MSGGSYDYLYVQEPEQIIDKEDDIKNMADRLDELGYIRESIDIKIMLGMIHHFKSSINYFMEKHSELLKDVEWLDSYDIGIDTLRKRHPIK